MIKNNMREHFLFKDRYRLLAVPPPANLSGPKSSGRKTLVNLAIIGFIFIFFGAGYWMAHSAQVDALLSGFGDSWNTWMQGFYGGDLGSTLAEKTPWILARAGGIMSYLALSASVMLGLFTSLRWVKGPRVMYLHRVLVLLGLVFLTTHLMGLAFDSYLRISIAQSLVPFAVSYRPLWTALGTISLYGILLVGISAYLAGKLGYKVWRSLHYLSFGMFWFSFLHGFFAGTDSSFAWMQLIYFTTGFMVVFLTGARIFKSVSKSWNVVAW